MFQFLILVATLSIVKGCYDGHCDDPNAYCTGGSFPMCKCKKGFYEYYSEDFSEHRCEPIPQKSVFDCKKLSFPCGKYDANFGNNEERKCFCTKNEFKKPIWFNCTPDKKSGRPCADANAICSGTDMTRSRCICDEKGGYFQVSKYQINEQMYCAKPPKNSIYYKCGTIHKICGYITGLRNFEMNGKCFCIPE